MGARGRLRTIEGGRVAFMCPGCKELHQVTILEVGPRGRERVGPCWGFNGDYDAPTFTPSILVTWSEPSDVPEEFDDTSKDKQMVCHSFVCDGRIQFLGDCTHELAGQTVDLPAMEGS